MTEAAVQGNPFAEQVLEKALETPVASEVDPTPRYSASSVGFCDRKLYYKKLGTPGLEHIPFDAECRMKVGTLIGDVVQKRILLHNVGAVEEVEIPPIEIEPAEVERVLGEEAHFSETQYCSLKLDAFVPCPYDESLDFICEVKSGNKKLLQALLPSYYKMQTGIYWRALWTKWVYFVLVDRAVFARKWVHLEDPEAAWKHALQVINFVEYHINVVKEPPPRPVHLGRRMCASCGYFHRCYRG